MASVRTSRKIDTDELKGVIDRAMAQRDLLPIGEPMTYTGELVIEALEKPPANIVFNVGDSFRIAKQKDCRHLTFVVQAVRENGNVSTAAVADDERYSSKATWSFTQVNLQAYERMGVLTITRK